MRFLDIKTDFAFKKVFGSADSKDIANEANLSVEELELQHKKKDWIYIQKSSIELATKTGLKQGIEEGINKASTAIALNLLEKGIDIVTIAEVTSLPESEIKQLLQKASEQ